MDFKLRRQERPCLAYAQPSALPVWYCLQGIWKRRKFFPSMSSSFESLIPTGWLEASEKYLLRREIEGWGEVQPKPPSQPRPVRSNRKPHELKQNIQILSPIYHCAELGRLPDERILFLELTLRVFAYSIAFQGGCLTGDSRSLLWYQFFEFW